jgi:hypothetical protein
MLLRQLTLAAALGAAVGADEPGPALDLRLELALERPPQRVHDDFSNGGSASVPSGTIDTPIDAEPPRIARIVAASGGGLAWGIGVELVDDRMRIADGQAGRAGIDLHQRLLGAFGMLGWRFAPLPPLELEATVYGAIGLARIHWISPDLGAGTAEAAGDGGYTEEGLRLAAGGALGHAMAQLFVGVAATQSGASIDYASGDSSELRIVSAGWTAGIAAGWRF